MSTIPTVSSFSTSNLNIPKAGPEHHEHDGDCNEPTCSLEVPHNHTSEYGCVSCIKDYLNKFFPLEKTIKDLNISNNSKQFLSMISNLVPAIGVSNIASSIHLDSLVASPLAISAMHFTNRGKNQLHKLLFTALSSIGLIAAQKFLSLPRMLIRPVMALAVFFIEKNNKKEEHVHTDECDHDHDEHVHEHTNECHDEHVHEHTDECNHEHVPGTKSADQQHISTSAHHSQSSHPQSGRGSPSAAKNDLINLGKLQVQINTVPWAVNLLVNKLREKNDASDNVFYKTLGKIGIFTTHILGLSGGFIVSGSLINKLLLHLGVISDAESLAMRAEGSVCACCGAPVCISEAASEVGALSIT